ncbi:MAG: TetR/AcrR family transcriptional regulator [Acidimicrobiales bacterium]
MEDWQLMEVQADEAGARLVDTARRLLEAGGPEAVQARKLASEIGASTMAVYTHFGGMSELFEALVRAGFISLRAQVEAVSTTDDPMADFFVQGMAYRQWALENPQLYRLIFGMSTAILPRRVAQDMTTSGTISLLPEGAAAFEVMIRSLERVKASNRIEPVDTPAAAGQFLSATHGYVLLEMADYFGPSGQAFATVLGPLAVSLMVGLGADRHDVDRSIASALIAVGIR